MLGIAAGGISIRFLDSLAPNYIPPLKVIGDVTSVETFKDISRIGKLEDITCQGKKYRAVRLADAIKRAGPAGKTIRLHLVGNDGFMSSIKADDIDDCYISYTSGNGWEALNLKHPVNTNAKDLGRIVVESDGKQGEHGLSVIDSSSDILSTTPGKLYAGMFTEYPYFEGKASVQHDGKTYESEVYTRRSVFKLENLIPLHEAKQFLVFGEKGGYRLEDREGFFELKGSYIDYIRPDTRDKVEKVRGIITGPSSAGIMDTYFDAQHYLESGSKVMVAVLDGFTYNLYEYSVKNGYAPFLAGSRKAVKSSGVYPVKDNTGFAAMITGKPPEENGIIEATEQILKVPSIFAEAKRLQRRTAFLESGQPLLNTEVQPVIPSDENQNGSTDDEMFNKADSSIEEGCDFIVLYFRSIGSRREKYGEFAPQTLQKVTVVDGYLAKLEKEWPGKVIVTGAQGNPDKQENDFTCDRMFVPYLN